MDKQTIDLKAEETESNPKTSPKRKKQKNEKAESVDAEDVGAFANDDIGGDEITGLATIPVKQDRENEEPDKKKSRIVPGTTELPGLFTGKQVLMGIIKNKIMEKEKADAKNALEEYVCQMRNKLGKHLEKFISEEDKNKLMAFLDETEIWLHEEDEDQHEIQILLHEEDEDQQKSVYVQRLNDLKKLGDRVVHRYNEWQQRPLALNEYGRTLQLVQKALQSYAAKEEQYAHIEEDEMKKVNKLWEEKDKWLGQHLGTSSKLLQHEDPPISAAQIKMEREHFENQVKPILSKPKSKIEPPPEENASTNQTQQANSEMKDTSTASEKVEKSQSCRV